MANGHKYPASLRAGTQLRYILRVEFCGNTEQDVQDWLLSIQGPGKSKGPDSSTQRDSLLRRQCTLPPLSHAAAASQTWLVSTGNVASEAEPLIFRFYLI